MVHGDAGPSHSAGRSPARLVSRIHHPQVRQRPHPHGQHGPRPFGDGQTAWFLLSPWARRGPRGSWAGEHTERHPFPGALASTLHVESDPGGPREQGGLRPAEGLGEHPGARNTYQPDRALLGGRLPPFEVGTVQENLGVQLPQK